jgi:hypothetical protein
MWTQMLGKIRLASCPQLNHWWHVALHPNARGLSSPAIPFRSRIYDVELDLVGHELVIQTNDGHRRALPLRSVPVSETYGELMRALRDLYIQPTLYTLPIEVPDPVRFENDTIHASYDPEWARRFATVVLQSKRVLERFRSSWLGKCSPVHFFWGGFDLAVTRFSGRRAPEHGPVPYTPLSIVREAYSHEVMSVGFWPGTGTIDAMYYAYAYPEPEGFREAHITSDAFYEPSLGEFILPYEAVRTARDPDKALLEFAENAYEACADLGHWDRDVLERPTERLEREAMPAELRT